MSVTEFPVLRDDPFPENLSDMGLLIQTLFDPAEELTHAELLRFERDTHRAQDAYAAIIACTHQD